MALRLATILGPSSVTAKIGEGGMGEVYQARDTKLDRDVALKVLPEAFTSDPDRLARFEREAKRLASLNPQGIAGIYGLEESGKTVVGDLR
jgi:serine/threonine protein kinase